MKSRPQIPFLLTVIGALFCITVPSTHAFIQNLFPLQEFIDDSDFLFTATIEKIDTEKPSAVLIVKDQLKGKAPFQRLPVNLTGDKQKHAPQLLKRIAPELTLVVGVKKLPEGKFMLLAFSNGTWFQVLGQSDGDQTRWAFTHCEIYLRRTFAGTTEELTQTVTDVLAGKAKSPAPNPKEPAGFGPVIKTAAGKP
ncbi:MAG: hypothetical protein JSS49_25395 [Planctomycetes bacterium]|nr:hypothetical protein [Planctomycetota bacterium]